MPRVARKRLRPESEIVSTEGSYQERCRRVFMMQALMPSASNSAPR
jgi:hypothetical protein